MKKIILLILTLIGFSIANTGGREAKECITRQSVKRADKGANSTSSVQCDC